jgi:adenylate cyclase
MTRRPTAGTVVFVDLVRFTSLTDIHGDVTAADAAETLTRIVRESLAEGVELVKSLGDGVLLVAEQPVDGLRTASAVIEQLHDGATGLDARGGLHHGAVVWRGNDVFGTAVNLAARLAALAQPGMLVMTRDVAIHGTELGLDSSPLGEQLVRGLRTPIEMFQIDPCLHKDDWVTDPVCGMRLRRTDALHPAGHAGFCSPRCEGLYRSEPDLYR